jgi:hypothetical protein
VAKMTPDELRIERRMGWLDPLYTFREAYGLEPLPWQVP